MEKKLLPNSYYRTCLNYAEMASFIYETSPIISRSTAKIHHVVKRANQEGYAEKMNAFRNLIKFRDVVPDLVRLLRTGGIWTLNCEQAYAAVVKCRIQPVAIVCYHYCPYLIYSPTGYEICHCCMCRSS
jgi:hypothetical protein